MDGPSRPRVRGGAAYRVRAGSLAVLTLALAYGGGLWLHLIHEAEGAHEPGEPSSLVHWLRDSTLLVPVVLVAVWLTLQLGRRYLAGRTGAVGRAVAAATLASAMALVTSVAEALSSPLHTALFGAHHEHGGVEMPLALHMAYDGVIALTANLAIVLVVVAMLRGNVWSEGLRSSAARRWTASLQLRRAFSLGASAALMLGSGLLPQTAPVAVLAASGPCPAGAPTKSFDVSAIDIRMWLNRFGDSDPQAQMFVLDSMIQAVRDQETAGRTSLSIGLRDDPMQPLAIRANEGDCVVIHFTNRTTRPAPQATDNVYGIHIDGLAFSMGSSGDAVGANASTSVGPGGTATYTYFVPDDPTLEGGHYMHPGPGNRQAVAHGLFGALVVEPPGSTYRNPTTGAAQVSGWEADIIPGDPAKKSFRENVKIFHEIGNESERNVPVDITGLPLPTIDPHTGAYRPGSRAINYRSEPFMDRLNFAEDQKAVVYGSYTFADTTNIIPRGYLGDPTKFRLMHAGSEIFHVYHLHGGSDRWRFNPLADPTYDYGKTGLDKHPVEVQSESARLDSQSIGPGESFNLEIENGAGGAQQGAGEFLFHCHIAHHYFSGMWGYWRVFDTLQPTLMPLPDRAPLPKAVDSSALIGKTIAGQTITTQNLDAWIRPQLPVQGVTKADPISPNPKDTADEDASVWDWSVDNGTGLYLGEPDRASTVTLGGASVPWPDFANAVPGHPAALDVDQTVQSTYLLNGAPVTFSSGGYVGSRPKILFNPTNGRPAWPLLRPHIGKRPPFAPNGHSGAPYLGEYGGQAANPVIPVGSTAKAPIDPWAGRTDGICPQGAPLRTYNIVGIAKPIVVTDPTKNAKVVDPLGALDVLAADKQAIYDGTKTYAGVTHPESLAIRGNIGDCLAITYTSELTDGGAELPYSRTNIHIHHVQFDTQASDGVISGFSFEQSIRPYKIVDPQLATAVAAGSDVLTMTSVTKFQPGVWIGVGLGTDGIEIRQISQISPNKNELKLSQKLNNAHAASEWAGTEFVQYRWYPDVELDNIFFHDHVNGIHGWSHGMVGQLIIEPTGSRYFDPISGAEIRAGAAADIHTDATCVPATDPVGKPSGTSNQCALVPGVVPASYREFAIWTVNDHEPAPPDGTLNLRAEPFADRTCADTSFLFAASCGGDPYTPILKAYVGDQVVIRNINVGQGTNTLTIDGHQTFWEPRYRDALGFEASPVDTIHTTVSEKFTLILKGGAGGPNHVAGDYLYHDGENRRFTGGAWGILRVLGSVDPSKLLPLPGTTTLPAQLPTCPTGAQVHTFAVSAVDLPSTAAGGGQDGRKAAFVPTSLAAAVIAKQVFPEPLVLHVAAGECIQVTLTNQRASSKASFHVGALLHDLSSSGINVGTNPGDQTVAPGASKTYTYYADTQKLESTLISDFGAPTASGLDGMYGSIVVAPAGATFTDPESGQATDMGSQVDVHVPGKPAFRDFTLLLADHDPRIGQSTMPYPRDVSGPALVNYRNAGIRADNASMFLSSANGGDPTTPLMQAYAGDPVKVHVLGAPQSDQVHVFNLGGMSWPGDMYIPNSSQWQSRGVGPWEKLDISVSGGAGGPTHEPGDYFYGDLRRAFTEAGMWGLFRVLPNTCSTGGTPGLACLGGTTTVNPPTVTGLSPAGGPSTGGTPVTITGTGFDTASGGTAVSFGATPATSVSCASTTSCSVTSPAGTGTVDVIVTANGQASAATAADQFTYSVAATPPTVTGISPTSGSTAGGTSVTVTGTGFNTAAGGTLIQFGATAASNVSCASSTSCTATTPAGVAGQVDVGVTANGLQSAVTPADQYLYVVPPPVVGFVQPSSGPATGGTSVTITGTAFSSTPGATTIQFGSNAATGVSCSSTTVCTATSPAGTGTVHIIVTVDGVASTPNAFDSFTYTSAVLTTTPVSIPALPKGNGYWFTFTSNAAGQLTATWSTPARAMGTLSIYAGNPFAGKADPVKLSPPAGALATDKGNKSSFATTIVGQPAGIYTVYFFDGGALAASSGSVTFMK
jgi:manganese oxidase